MPESNARRAAAPAQKAAGGKTVGDGNYQLLYAHEIRDETLAPRHPGDHTPRLLVERLRPSHGGGGGGCGVSSGCGVGSGGGDDGEFVTGRLLLSPWSAFKGIVLLAAY